ncbi:MAG: oligosaccharide flippase family protein, partial [Muribaculaceae bacterium]|nr:oligosaccharide flippase family protein [Muribaculaceae bacterium]
VQDDPETFKRYMTKVNRFTGFILFPLMIGLAAIGAPLFHTLFGHKWDAAIPIYQILTIRGIFIVLISLHNNFILSIGAAKRLFMVEVMKDALIFIAILSTMWTANLTLIVWGQFIASAITFLIVTGMTARITGYRAGKLIADLLPSLLLSLAMGAVCLLMLSISLPPVLSLLALIAAGGGIYILLARICRLPELNETLTYLLGRFKKQK